jgi:putative protease
MKRPELLSPAGDMEKLTMAVLYGADAVYLAGKQFGLREKAGNFDLDQLKTAVDFCHSHGVKVYVTCNTLPRCDEIPELPTYLAALDSFGVDAFIVADLGVFRMAQKYAPHVEKHISTQSGVVNYETAAAWYDLGATRVVLAREMSFDEICTLRAKAPAALELETFIHGSMCVSFSGRCLLSNYMAGRDANRGACAQPCRWKYALVEERRPGEYIPIEEDDGGAYIMSSKDLCMIDHIPELIDAGIASFKIEGRAKSSYYAASVTAAYRHGIDAALAGEPLAPIWRDEVQKISHRAYWPGFYFGQRSDGQIYDDNRYIRAYGVAAYVLDCDADGNAVCTQRGRFWTGDTLELLAPGHDPVQFRVDAMQNADGEEITVCPHAEMELHLKLPFQAPKMSILRRRTDDPIPDQK